jgi:hypothetical protein
MSHTKPYLASPPYMLRVDEKNIPEHEVMNCVGVIFTTNHKTDGIYLPPVNRRHDVIWSNLTNKDFDEDYWTKMYAWYDKGGAGHVAAYLATLDISAFDPKAPPPKTEAFWAIVNANRAPEEGELQDALDGLGNPDAFTLLDIQGAAEYGGDLYKLLEDKRNRRTLPHRFESVGYVPVNNKAATSGLWVVNGKRQVVYSKSTLALSEQLKAVGALQQRECAREKVVVKKRVGAVFYNGEKR